MTLKMSRLVAAAAMTVLATGAFAGEAADKAAEAERLAMAGQAAEAVAAFDAASDALWRGLPLTFRVALFADNVSAYGKYDPRATSEFKSGEAVTIYLEPVGYGFASSGTTNTVAFGTAIEIRTPGGLILGKTDDLEKLTWTGRAKSREVHAAINLALPTLKPGAYELVLTLTDAASAKTATTTLPFTIVE